jgi:hypothetical protein
MKNIIIIVLIAISGSLFSQTVQDSIEIRKGLGNSFRYQGKLLLPKKLKEIVSVNPEAAREIKRANTNMVFGTILGGAGGGLIGYPVGTALAGGKANWTLAAAGAFAILVSIPFSVAYNNHTTKAVRIYNEGIRQTTDVKKLNFELGYTPDGIGVRMRF